LQRRRSEREVIARIVTEAEHDKSPIVARMSATHQRFSALMSNAISGTTGTACRHGA
jgi:hypothetical protein